MILRFTTKDGRVIDIKNVYKCDCKDDSTHIICYDKDMNEIFNIAKNNIDLDNTGINLGFSLHPSAVKIEGKHIGPYDVVEFTCPRFDNKKIENKAAEMLKVIKENSVISDAIKEKTYVDNTVASSYYKAVPTQEGGEFPDKAMIGFKLGLK